jgi:SAM-dependent methyltransferase
MSSTGGIAKLYHGSDVAEKYVGERFASDIGRLLHSRQVTLVNQVIAAIQPRRVLEIAPGPGRLTRDVKSPGALFCLEYNEGMIDHGRSVCDRQATWVRGDGFQLPFGQVFDLVYSLRFVRHFHCKDRERLYSEIKRVLRPGGCFLIDAVNERFSRPLRAAHPEEYPVYDKLYRPDELRNELNKAGLEPVALLPVQKYFSWQCRSQTFLGPRSRWANRIVIGALERVPWGEGLEWVVTCRRN